MRISTDTRRRAVITVVVALGLSLAAAGPATAADSSVGAPTKGGSIETRYCELARVGDQFVRCDDLTGEGVPAPNWVPES